MTFHALGLTILRENAARFDLPPDFRVADDQERTRLLVEGADLSERQAGRLLAEISRSKRGGEATVASPENAAARETYRRLMRERALVDFDDLILLPAELLQREPALAAEYRRRWPWISVDEYQDLDDNQYRLLRQLAAADGNLCAIGDPDQSIYGFRGSNPEIFLHFTQDFPSARVVRLTRNYRSSQAIVAAALQAIAPTSLVSDRILQALSQNADRISIHTSPTERAEAEFVVHTIERSIGGSTFFSLDSGRVDAPASEARSFADFAVLYRTEAQADALVEAFARSGIPFQKKSHRRWSEEPAVQAIIRFLQESRPAPPPTTSVGDHLRQAAEAVSGEHPEAADCVVQLAPLAERCGDDVSRFLSELALGIDADSWDPRADRVSLLTLHAAKGLEFPVVFLVGCEDGLLPLRWGPADDADVAEERRLFFVGLTRARERLLLSHARQRLWRGQVRDMQPSPFLEQIREELLERIQQAQGRKKRRSTDTQLQLF
jgi:superfamily I DNA/RNA helicase